MSLVMVTAVLDISDLLEGKNEFGFQCDLRKEARVDYPNMIEVQTDLRETERRTCLLGLQNGVLVQV